MLAIDTANVSETQIAEIVAHHLAPFGRPTIIKVMPRERHRMYEVVAVKMANRAQARYIAARLGHSHYGPIVVVKLAQPGATASLPLPSQLVH
jgi:hypothetical protein